jgi:hypothetical protein
VSGMSVLCMITNHIILNIVFLLFQIFPKSAIESSRTIQKSLQDSKLRVILFIDIYFLVDKDAFRIVDNTQTSIKDIQETTVWC